MTHLIPRNALIVVADGGKAMLLRDTGPVGKIALKVEKHYTLKDFVNDGPSGSRPVEQSRQQTDEATFAKQLAHVLTTMHDRNAFEHLVLIADPRTLGELREALHKHTEKTIAWTMSKDYTNSTVAEIEKALSA